jgi:hypothetical protein
MRVSASSRLSDESLDRADRVDLKLVDQADGVGELERELRLGPLDEVESGRARGDALTLDRGNTLRGHRVGIAVRTSGVVPCAVMTSRNQSWPARLAST